MGCVNHAGSGHRYLSYASQYLYSTGNQGMNILMDFCIYAVHVQTSAVS